MNITSTSYPHFYLGVLLLRLGIGISFICHGWPKLQAGPELWESLGGAMSFWGINFAPTLWGFIGSLAEFAGGLLLALGFLFRPTCVILVIQMIVATSSHLSQGQSFSEYSHALEMAILFFCWLFIGPGKYSLDARLQKPTERLGLNA
ncbi:DoxX family protein [Adhaeribacter rhizoryzae]|uniref:DoxX family protein n=1 Tax=Adhaeribacter rhizoryzae TaxID=2607907 RepID=A0A5M6DMF9_9BACT|nr:DoxX family protein [Adhaeribacter rhizoryzae]KAA5547442.1 DoxX family protein [Adhaeribacter rhizoryzae]